MLTTEVHHRISVQFRAAILLSVPAESDSEAIRVARTVLATSPNDVLHPLSLRNPLTRAFGCLGAVAGALHDRHGSLIVEGVLKDAPDRNGDRDIVDDRRFAARLTRGMRVVNGNGSATSGAINSLLARCNAFARSATNESDRQNNLTLARYLEAAAKIAARLEQSLDPGPHCGAVA